MVDCNTVESWFDENIIQNYQLAQRDGVNFNYKVNISEWNLHVIQKSSDAPLRVVGESRFRFRDTFVVVRSG